jgi:hypothetical protein
VSLSNHIKRHTVLVTDPHPCTASSCRLKAPSLQRAPVRRWPLAGGAGDPYNAEEVEVGRDSLLFSSEANLAFIGSSGGGSYSRARERHSTVAVRIVMDALASYAGAKT